MQKEHRILKMITSFLLLIVPAVLLSALATGLYRNYQIEHSEYQQSFLQGSIPNPTPDGFYRGDEHSDMGKSWEGKTFDASQQTGINKFSDGDRFRFKTSQARGLRDKNTKVLRIDYSQPGNPWWLRFITDEIVQTSPGHFLGKVHLRVIPGLPFTLMYFTLTK